MHEMREELEDLVVPRALSGRLSVSSPSGSLTLAARNKRPDRRDRTAAHAQARRSRHRPRRVKGRAEARLFDLAQDGAQVGRLRAAFGHLRFRVIVEHGAECYQALGIVAHDLAGRAGPLQGLHLDAEAERLSLDPHHGDRAGQAARRTADPHPRRWTRSPNTASPRMRSTRMATVRRPRCCRANRTPMRWLRRTIELLAEGSNPEEFLEHTKLELFHDQVFCFTPEGQADRAAAQGDADRFRLCGAHRRRQHGGRLPRSTARSRRWRRNCRTATKSRSSPQRRRRRRRRPGNRSWSPARRARRSGAPPASRCARQYAGLGRAHRRAAVSARQE